MGLYIQKLNTRTGQFNLVPSGTVITFKAGVANAAALPASSNTQNDARITNDNGHLHIWSGTAWVDQGDIVDLEWSVISNKPSSSVANIDDAVNKRHDGTLQADKNITINTPIYVSGVTDYTLVLTDDGKLVNLDNSVGNTLTIPKNSVVAFPIGTSIAICQVGVGVVTITPVDGDVTLQSQIGLKTTGQYAMASLVKIATDTWLVTGSLEA